jgi:transcriptional regulator with XRE-family HTH domain
MHMPKKEKPEAPRHFLRKWREFLDLSLEEVAADIGTTHATLSRVERGKGPYSQWLLEALAWRYRVSVGDLISRDPEAQPAKKQAPRASERA